MGEPATGEPNKNFLAFEILVHEHHRSLMSYAHALLSAIGHGGDHNAAEDLVQDALVVAFENLHRFDFSRDFAAWARGIIRYRHLKGARSREFTMEESALVAIGDIQDGWQQKAAMNPTEQDEQEDLIERLRLCLSQLSDHLRLSIEGFYLRGVSVRNLAEETSTTTDAVKKRLQRGRELLSNCLNQSPPTPILPPRRH